MLYTTVLHLVTLSKSLSWEVENFIRLNLLLVCIFFKKNCNFIQQLIKLLAVCQIPTEELGAKTA